MTIEIEAKMHVDDQLTAEVEQRLIGLGARLVGYWLEADKFFDSVDGSFRGSHNILRLRTRTPIKVNAEEKAEGEPAREAGGEVNREGKIIFVTYKGPKLGGQLKSRRELEMAVECAETTINIFAELGYQPVFGIEKRRKEYQIDQCNIELDEVPYLGRFIEIEGPDEDTVLKMRETLGLGQVVVITNGYSSMIATYMNEHDIKSREASF